MRTEVLTFLRQHWRHVLLLVFPGSLLVTLAHESAHALAVWGLGGQVTQFVWLPTAGHWGFVRFQLPSGSPGAQTWVALAPYLLWSALALTVATISLTSAKLPAWAARILFVWLFAVPLADIGNTAFGYLAGDSNDFFSAWGKPTSVAAILITGATGAALIGGFFVQCRLYQEDALGIAGYGLLGSLTLFTAVAINVTW